MTSGVIIAAPASGSGKTTVTLALLRHLRTAGVKVGGAKIGPDYIDPAFHTAACGRPCFNIDSWAMRPATLARVVARLGQGTDLVIAEGVMGLFDGAPDGAGSSADVARATGWPVVLVVDAGGMAASAAALIHGFASYQPDLSLAGVIFNRVGSAGHAALLAEACADLGLAVLGALPKDEALRLPDRHLGLVQAAEHPDLEAFLDRAASQVAQHLDTDQLMTIAGPATLIRPADDDASATPLPPLGQRIAVARDQAFAFCYPLLLEAWRGAGAEIMPFSPLADEAPDGDADAVYLPGGYPELHAGRLAGNGRVLDGLRQAAARGCTVYGECGGFMVLGRSLTDADGKAHAMAGLLPVDTSFAAPRLSLGYRQARLDVATPLGARGNVFRGHEFHFARIEAADDGPVLFRCRDARGRDLGPRGMAAGTVAGSFVHLIDRDAPGESG